MSASFARADDETIRAGLAGAAYDSDTVRLTGAAVRGSDGIVATRRGLYGVSRDGSVVLAAHGFFFGLRHHDDGLLLFEACDRTYTRSRKGRLVHLAWNGDRLGHPRVLVRGLDNQCHQVAAFDGALWVVDTAHQAVLQFAPDGTPTGRHTPFPIAPPDDITGGYLHLNGIAEIGDRIALMLHNGRAEPPRASELAWVDRDWTLLDRSPLPGRCCHDIVADEGGVLWHCDSVGGAVMTSAGARIAVTSRMTRGLAIDAGTIMVGTSNLASRDARDDVAGSVVFIDRATDRRTEVMLPGAPTDLVLS